MGISTRTDIGLSSAKPNLDPRRKIESTSHHTQQYSLGCFLLCSGPMKVWDIAHVPCQMHNYESGAQARFSTMRNRRQHYIFSGTLNLPFFLYLLGPLELWGIVIVPSGMLRFPSTIVWDQPRYGTPRPHFAYATAVFSKCLVLFSDH